MGRPKLLLPLGGGTVLGALVDALGEAGVSPIVVVAAAADAALRAWCAARTGPTGRLLGAVNPAPERGMLSSILAGLAALGGAAAIERHGLPLLVTPGDLPALRASTVVELVRRATTAGAPLAVPTWRSRRGHPLLIAPHLAAEVERLDPARGLHQLLDIHAGAVLKVEVDDPGCVTDLDTPADYAALEALL